MSRIFVGNLPEDATKGQVEREFETYGVLRDVWVARNPPGFGFLMFEENRDAEDAVKEMDGRTLSSDYPDNRLRVELARGGGRGGRRGGGGGGRGGMGSDRKCYECGRSGHLQRDCRQRGEGGSSGYGHGGGGGGRRRSRSRSRSRSPRRRSSHDRNGGHNRSRSR